MKNKKGFELSLNFIIGLALTLLVVGVIAIWLYWGKGSINTSVKNFVQTNIIQKLGF